MARAEPPESRRPSFGRELYSLAVICLLGSLVALVVLPPRLERHFHMLSVEKELRRGVDALRERERQYAAAISAMEDDPHYREAAYRRVLGVQKVGEETLKFPGEDFR